MAIHDRGYGEPGERDGDAGLDDFNARSLQMRTGRMNRPDPLFGNAPVNPQRWNAYSYVTNNPLTYTDPSGMDLVFRVEVIGYEKESILVGEFRVGGLFWGIGGDLPGTGFTEWPEPDGPGGGTDSGQPPPSTPSRPGQPQPPPSQPTPDPCSGGARGPREWAGNLTDLSAGFGDGLLVVLGPWLREELGLDEVVDQSSGWYETGSWLSFAVGFGRVAYAGLANGGAAVASSGIAASTFRSQLKTTFRLGMGRNFRSPNLSKYPTDEALRAAAGRTNPYANVYGAAISAGSLRAATGCSGK